MSRPSSGVPQLPQLYFPTRPLSGVWRWGSNYFGRNFDDSRISINNLESGVKDVRADDAGNIHTSRIRHTSNVGYTSDARGPSRHQRRVPRIQTLPPNATIVDRPKVPARVKHERSKSENAIGKWAGDVDKALRRTSDRIHAHGADSIELNPVNESKGPVSPASPQSTHHAGSRTRSTRARRPSLGYGSTHYRHHQEEDPDIITPAPRQQRMPTPMPMTTPFYSYVNGTKQSSLQQAGLDGANSERRNIEIDEPENTSQDLKEVQPSSSSTYSTRAESDHDSNMSGSHHSVNMEEKKEDNIHAPRPGTPEPAKVEDTTHRQDFQPAYANGDVERGPDPRGEVSPLAHVTDNRFSATSAGTDPLALCDPQPAGTFSPPPDGGWTAWLHAIFGALAIANCWGYNLAFGVFETYYKISYIPNHSHATIAWIGSVQLFLIFFTAIVVGRCYDLGLYRVFFHGGSVGLVVAMFATSACKSWGALFAVQGILTGVCQGAVFCSGVLVVTEYFDKNIGLAIGIGAAGSSLGGIIYTLMAQNLLPSAGFGWTIRAMAFVAVATLIPSNIILKSRRKKRSKQGPRPKVAYDWSFITDPAYVLMLWGMFFSFWALYFGFYYIVSYANTVLRMSPSQSVNVFITMLVTNFPGRFLPALSSDRCIGPLNTLIPSTLVTAMVIFLWIGTATPGGIYVLAAFYGFASAGLQSLFSPAVTEFCRGDDATRGLKNAVVFMAIGLACLTGTPIGGALIDAGGTPKDMPYLWAQIFAGVTMTLGGLCFLGSRVMKVGWGPVRT